MTAQEQAERELRSTWKQGGPVTKELLEKAGYWPIARATGSGELYGRTVGEVNPYAGRYGTGWTIVESKSKDRSGDVIVGYWTKGPGTRRKFPK